MVKLMVAVVVAMASVFAQAATVHNVSKEGQSIFLPASWGITAFSDQDDYVLDSGYLCNTGFRDGTFTGKSFQVQGVDFEPNVNNSVMTFPRDGISFSNTATLRYRQTDKVNAELTFKGTQMTIGASTGGNNLFRIGTTKSQPYGCTYIFDLPLHGSRDAYIKLAYYKTAYNGWSKLVLRGDCSDYKGVIWVNADDPISAKDSDNLTTAPEHCNELVFDNDTFDGWKIFVERRCSVTLPTNGCVKTGWFQLTNEAGATNEAVKLIYRWNGNTVTPTYGHLGLVDFSDIDAAAKGTVSFTNDVDLEFVVPTELAVFCAENTGNPDNRYERAVTLLTTKQPISSDYQSRFCLTMTGEAPYGAESRMTPTLRFVAMSDGGTRVQAVGTWPRFSYLMTGDASAASNHGSSLLAQNATNWTDGTTMNTGVSYVVTKGLQLMTHENIPAFTGDRLILEGKDGSSRSRLALISSSFGITNLYCYGGSMIQGFKELAHLTGGPIHFAVQSCPAVKTRSISCRRPTSQALNMVFLLTYRLSILTACR